MNIRCGVVVLVVAVLAVGCGDSIPPTKVADDAATFHNAIVATISAKSFRFSIKTQAGSQPAAAAVGRFIAPDRSVLTVGDVERVTVGDASYFRGGGFGTDGWAKADEGATGDPDFLAVLIVAQNANPVVRRGSVYSVDIAASGEAPDRHWKLWIEAGRVARVLYSGGPSFTWDERFTDYGAAFTIDEPPAAESHPVTDLPVCVGGGQPDFVGFCKPA